MAKSKNKPTIPPANWDIGPCVLAVLGDVPEMVTAFRKHLIVNRQAREAVMAEPNVGETKKDAARRRTRATTVTRTWMIQNGYTIHTEEATWADEDGNPVNPNGVRRARRIDLIELYHKRGIIDVQGFNAAKALRMAFEATMKSPPAIKEIDVDTSPKPDQNVAIMMDRLSAYSRIMGMVPKQYRPIVDCVVIRNASPAWIGYKGRRYRKGVQLAADGISALADVMERERG